MSRLPIRARLVAGFALAMVVVLAGAGAFVFWRVQYALDHRLGEDLTAQTADLRDAAATQAPRTALAAQARESQLFDARGRTLATGSAVARDHPLLTAAQARAAIGGPVRTGRGNLFSARGAHLRTLAVPVRSRRSGGTAVAATAVRLDQRDEALRELLVQLALANLIALGLASIVGYRVARSALDPVERYRAQAERIANGASGVRLDVPSSPRDEINRLGMTLNTMLTAQERAAERQQQFVDDASHELRTPISALAAEVDLALRRPRSPEELTNALRRIAGDTTRLADLAEELLSLGAMGSSVPDARPVLARLQLERAAERAREPLAQDPRRAGVVLDVPDDTCTFADEKLLARALGNLVDNAVRHGAGTITLTAQELDGEEVPSCLFRVHDQGPGLGAEFLPRAAKRFRREQTSRTGPGSGLGLSLVDAIATAHHGQLRICSNGAHHHQPTTDDALAAEPCRHPDPGTTVSLLLPGRPRAAEVLSAQPAPLA